MMKRILFVDDEPDILAGLQDLLHRDRKRWDMVFALGGQVALDEIRKESFDIVVSDMRMSGVDGATLLNVVKDEYPATVRIVLSGHADPEVIVRALPAMHQLLSKPCNAATLRAAIERSLGGANISRDVAIHRLVGAIDKLPTPSDIFFELTRLMESPTSSMTDVARVVTRDPGLSAKLLQLVNTAFFGAGQVTKSIQQAVGRLGTERLRYIALTTSVFASSNLDDTCWFSLQGLQRGAMQAAVVAQEFADRSLRDEAFASTLLHDVGHVVLALAHGPEFEAFHREPTLDGLELDLDEEMRLIGLTHADVGARLLAIWGLPSTIVDAIQFHHDPGSAPEPSRRLASIVHVADTIVHHMPVRLQLNMESLERAGCADLVPEWLAIGDRMMKS